MSKPSTIRLRIDVMDEDFRCSYSIQKEYPIETMFKGGAVYMLQDAQNMMDACFNEARKMEERHASYDKRTGT